MGEKINEKTTKSEHLQSERYGNLRTGGIASWFEDFDPDIVIERAKNATDTIPDIDIDFEKQILKESKVICN